MQNVYLSEIMSNPTIATEGNVQRVSKAGASFEGGWGPSPPPLPKEKEKRKKERKKRKERKKEERKEERREL